MIKVVMLDSYAGRGGGQTIVYSLLKDLKERFEFLVVAPTGEYMKKYRELGVLTHELPSTSFMSAIRSIMQLIKIEQPDIIHVHGTRAAVWLRLALLMTAKKNRPKVVYTVHGFHIARKKDIKSKFLLVFEKILNKLIDVLVVASKADEKIIKDLAMIDTRRLQFVPNGIDLLSFNVSFEKVAQLQKKLNVNENFVVMIVSRLHAPKDLITPLRALDKLKIDYPTIKLVIVGDGPDRSMIEAEIKKLQLEDNVVMLGERKDIPELLSIADILIFSTNWEGLPLVPLEAAAAKVPIVASDVVGVTEIVKHEETGLLVPAKDVAGFANAIKKLYCSEQLRTMYANQAYTFVKNTYTAQAMSNAYKNIYKSLV